jgi:hypothetical protein
MCVFGLSVSEVVAGDEGGLLKDASIEGWMSKELSSKAVGDGTPPFCPLSSSRTSVVRDVF